MDRLEARECFLFGFVLVCLIGCPSSAYAAQHNVGGAAGWSIPAIVNVNYSTWAQSNSFHVGDTLLFTYNTSFHDVDQVTETNYVSCNDANPEAHYADGNTSIQLSAAGSYYFICGVPGHCSAGQKVAVLIKASTNASAPAPSPTSEPAEAPSPSPPSSAGPDELGTPGSSSLPVRGGACKALALTSAIACSVVIVVTSSVYALFI